MDTDPNEGERIVLSDVVCPRWDRIIFGQRRSFWAKPLPSCNYRFKILFLQRILSKIQSCFTEHFGTQKNEGNG
jgi:hypothetical protein